MRRRALLALAVSAADPAAADGSGPSLSSYYARHLLLRDGVVWQWEGRGRPQRVLDGVRQVGAARDHSFALLHDGTLLRWSDDARAATRLARGIASFAAGHSGWFAIDPQRVLWHARQDDAQPRRIADRVRAACIGDSADYYVSDAGELFVQGLAHRGQYGDGKLSATPGFVATAADVLDVKAHTGHAIHLRRDAVVMGTGGNRYGPLSSHGLGDKADRWGAIFDGARAIATGSRHSAAIRGDGSLWVWGEGFAIAPRQVMAGVVAVACGDTATIALTGDGALWQWEGGDGPFAVRWA